MKTLRKKTFLLLCGIFFLFVVKSNAQSTLYCPPNGDFENGDYSVWTYYIGTCCPISTPTLAGTPPAAIYIPQSFALTGPAPGVIGALNDPYGGFPVVGNGLYSLRIGSCRTNFWANKVVYYVHVPASLTNYSLIYKYAVVLEDPGHSVADQPRFTVQAFDSATNTLLPCANFNYVAGALPGFVGPMSKGIGAPCASTSILPIGPCPTCGDVYYKPWDTYCLNLSAYSGHTIRMEFAAGDCGLGAHFGYGYVDMNCSLFAISTIGCGDSVATLSAPSGFANYTWYDSTTFTILYGTTQTVTFPMPVVPTTYAVIMSPYIGFGCADTLYTHIRPSNLRLHPFPDTFMCGTHNVLLSSGATDIALPLSYSWTPATSLNCATCATPVATPPAGVTVYTVLVTNDAGCQKETTQKVTVDSVAATIASTAVSCFGYADGSATLTPTSGVSPYIYSWVTVPVQTTSTVINLAAGTYTVTVKDAKGCIDTANVTVSQPPPLTMAIGGFTDPTTCGGSDGTITITGLVADTPYTIRYLYTATGTTTTVAVTLPPVAASGTGIYIIGSLAQGSYDSIKVITLGCQYNTLGPIVLRDPLPPALPIVTSNSPVCLGDKLELAANDVTPLVTYTWGGPASYVSTQQTNTVVSVSFANMGWYVVTVTKDNCFSKDSTLVVVHDIPYPVASSNTDRCSGDTLRLFSAPTSPGGADAYLWGGPGGYISNFQNPFIPNAPASASGVYTVTITYHGCSGSITTTVTVNQTPDPPIVRDTNYCQDQFPPLYLAPGLTAVGTNLRWFTSMAAMTGNTVAPVPSTAVTGITTWYVNQTSNDTHPCTSAKAPISVGIYKFPDPKFVVSDSVFCQGTYFTFEVTNQNTGNDFEGITWSFDHSGSLSEIVQNTNPIVHTFGAIGTTTITANVYYKVCPDVMLSHSALVYPHPALNLGPDTSVCPGGEPVILGDYENKASLGATWLWSTGETTSTKTVVAPGTFYTKVTVNGCSTTDTIIVLNDCYMNIPNVFSPNGDGVNDYFYPRQLLTRGLTSFSMNIYNRWGQLVFTTNSLDGRGWDGKFNDIPQPEGVFVYVIDATFKDGQKEHHQGNITLMR